VSRANQARFYCVKVIPEYDAAQPKLPYRTSIYINEVMKQ